MISFLKNRPALLVGRHTVIGYELSWLSEALAQAATKASLKESSLARDIYHGVSHYLENDCPLRQLPIEELFQRIRHMLSRIGFKNVAEKLETVAPPVTISLLEIAKRSEGGFELAFFQNVRAELIDLKEHGVETLTFADLQECVLFMKSAKKWTKACVALEAEITDFLQVFDANLEAHS